MQTKGTFTWLTECFIPAAVCDFIHLTLHRSGRVTEPILLGYKFQLNNLETYFTLAAAPSCSNPSALKKEETLWETAEHKVCLPVPLSTPRWTHGEQINSHWALKKAGAQATAFCSSSYRLRLLAPPTPPPHICINFKDFLRFLHG